MFCLCKTHETIHSFYATSLQTLLESGPVPKKSKGEISSWCLWREVSVMYVDKNVKVSNVGPAVAWDGKKMSILTWKPKKNLNKKKRSRVFFPYRFNARWKDKLAVPLRVGKRSQAIIHFGMMKWHLAVYGAPFELLNVMAE